MALTIDSLVQQDLPRDEYEILIVDNGSSPENAEILRSQTGAYDRPIRYVHEPVIGESSARNCAIRECRTDFLAFIDDDAVASRCWLSSILAAFDSAPRLGALGGKITLRYAQAPPDWLDGTLVPYLSAFDHGETRCDLSYAEYPRGANMAFRREVFDDAGIFSEHFGRKGDCLLSYSEIEMCYRIEQAGWRIEYLPEAVIEHIVPRERLAKDWFERRIYWQGQSIGLFELTHFGRLHVLKRLIGQIAGLLRKDGVHRRIHAGYLAAVRRHFLSGRTAAVQSA